jgi:hypothetical protein
MKKQEARKWLYACAVALYLIVASGLWVDFNAPKAKRKAVAAEIKPSIKKKVGLTKDMAQTLVSGTYFPQGTGGVFNYASEAEAQAQCNSLSPGWLVRNNTFTYFAYENVREFWGAGFTTNTPDGFSAETPPTNPNTSTVLTYPDAVDPGNYYLYCYFNFQPYEYTPGTWRVQCDTLDCPVFALPGEPYVPMPECDEEVASCTIEMFYESLSPTTFGINAVAHVTPTDPENNVNSWRLFEGSDDTGEEISHDVTPGNHFPYFPLTKGENYYLKIEGVRNEECTYSCGIPFSYEQEYCGLTCNLSMVPEPITGDYVEYNAVFSFVLGGTPAPQTPYTGEWKLYEGTDDSGVEVATFPLVGISLSLDQILEYNTEYFLTVAGTDDRSCHFSDDLQWNFAGGEIPEPDDCEPIDLLCDGELVAPDPPDEPEVEIVQLVFNRVNTSMVPTASYYAEWAGSQRSSAPGADARVVRQSRPYWRCDFSNCLLNEKQKDDLIALHWRNMGGGRIVLVRVSIFDEIGVFAGYDAYGEKIYTPQVIGSFPGALQLKKRLIVDDPDEELYYIVQFPEWQYDDMEAVGATISGSIPWKPMPDVRIYLDGVEIFEPDFSIDPLTGIVTSDEEGVASATGGFYVPMLMPAAIPISPDEKQAGHYRIDSGVRFEEPPGVQTSYEVFV